MSISDPQRRPSPPPPWMISVTNRSAPKRMPTFAEEVEAARKWVDEQVAKSCVHGVISFAVWLTPALATVLQERNPMNRVRRGSAGLAKLVKEIEAGKFVLNGESMILAKTGEMNDGGTRNAAVLLTGKAIQTVIVFGVERATRLTVDQGIARKLSHMLQMHGLTYAHASGTVAQLVLNYEKHGRFSRLNGPDRPSHEELLAWCLAHPGLPEYLNAVLPIVRLTGCHLAPLAALYYIFSQIDQADTDADNKAKNTRLDLTENHPVYKLRQYLLQHGRAGKLRRSDEEVAAVTIKAWNSWRRGVPIRLLLWRNTGTRAETFPRAL